MPERDAKLAVRMAFHITQWIETSNDRWDIEIRDKLIDSIYETTFKQKILRAELYLQLLNQTAGSMHLFREFNTWALWIQLAKLIECCSVRFFVKCIDFTPVSGSSAFDDRVLESYCW